MVLKTYRCLALVGLAACLAGSFAVVHAQGQAHVIQTPKETQWGPAPPFIPAGAQIAVLAGDPGKAAPYTVKLKFPANYKIAAHSHPTDENVVVIAGTLNIGMGDKLATTGNKALGVGGFALMPANMNHYAYTTAAETTIVLYGVGPVEFKYVNPTDDPRHAKPSATTRRD